MPKIAGINFPDEHPIWLHKKLLGELQKPTGAGNTLEQGIVSAFGEVTDLVSEQLKIIIDPKKKKEDLRAAFVLFGITDKKRLDDLENIVYEENQRVASILKVNEEKETKNAPPSVQKSLTEDEKHIAQLLAVIEKSNESENLTELVSQIVTSYQELKDNLEKQIQGDFSSTPADVRQLVVQAAIVSVLSINIKDANVLDAIWEHLIQPSFQKTGIKSEPARGVPPKTPGDEETSPSAR